MSSYNYVIVDNGNEGIRTQTSNTEQEWLVCLTTMGIQIKKQRERSRVHALINRPGAQKRSYIIL